MKKKSKNRPAAKEREFADFLIAAASLVFIFSMIFAVSSWREEQMVYRTSKESLYYDIMEEDYASLAEVYCREYAGGAEMPEKTEAYLSVGRYYYAAMMADAADGAAEQERCEHRCTEPQRYADARKFHSQTNGTQDF